METASFKFTMDMPTMVTRPKDKVPRDAPKRCLSSYGKKARGEGRRVAWRPRGQTHGAMKPGHSHSGHRARLPGPAPVHPQPRIPGQGCHATGPGSRTAMAGAPGGQALLQRHGLWMEGTEPHESTPGPSPRGCCWCQCPIPVTPIPLECLPPREDNLAEGSDGQGLCSLMMDGGLTCTWVTLRPPASGPQA